MPFAPAARCITLALLVATSTTGVDAKVLPERLAALDGPQLTCMGAERAGSPAGVAAYSGKFFGKWPGVKSDFGFEPGPYAAEKPVLVITSQNAAQYAARLTAGQAELLKKYPGDYRIAVY